jgi:type IV pilus assembly protein PilV
MKPATLNASNRSRQRGVSLIEILAAVVIFSVSLAGLAGLSLTSLRSTADGHFNSQATILADQLADTMRSNLTGYETGQFASMPASTEASCAPGSTCTAAEQAQFDAGKWTTLVADVLPGGAAVICMDSTPDDGQPDDFACDGEGMNTVKLFWLDSRSADVLAEGETFHRHVVTVVP